MTRRRLVFSDLFLEERFLPQYNSTPSPPALPSPLKGDGDNRSEIIGGHFDFGKSTSAVPHQPMGPSRIESGDRFSDRGKRSPLVENHFPKIGKSASVEIHRNVRGHQSSSLTSQMAGPVNDVDPCPTGTPDTGAPLKKSARGGPPQRLPPSPATAAGVSPIPVGRPRQIRTAPVTHRNALCHAASRDRHCDARCKAYRSGLRRALAAVVIQRLYAEERRAEMKGRRFDDSRRGKVTAFKLAADRINRLMLEPCPFENLKGQ